MTNRNKVELLPPNTQYLGINKKYNKALFTCCVSHSFGGSLRSLAVVIASPELYGISGQTFRKEVMKTKFKNSPIGKSRKI